MNQTIAYESAATRSPSDPEPRGFVSARFPTATVWIGRHRTGSLERHSAIRIARHRTSSLERHSAVRIARHRTCPLERHPAVPITRHRTCPLERHSAVRITRHRTCPLERHSAVRIARHRTCPLHDGLLQHRDRSRGLAGSDVSNMAPHTTASASPKYLSFISNLSSD